MVGGEGDRWQERADAQQQPQHGARVAHGQSIIRRLAQASASAGDTQRPCAIALHFGDIGAERPHRPHQRHGIVAPRGITHQRDAVGQQRRQQVAQGVILRAG